MQFANLLDNLTSSISHFGIKEILITVFFVFICVIAWDVFFRKRKNNFDINNKNIDFNKIENKLDNKSDLEIVKYDKSFAYKDQWTLKDWCRLHDLKRTITFDRDSAVLYLLGYRDNLLKKGFCPFEKQQSDLFELDNQLSDLNLFSPYTIGFWDAQLDFTGNRKDPNSSAVAYFDNVTELLNQNTIPDVILSQSITSETQIKLKEDSFITNDHLVEKDQAV